MVERNPEIAKLQANYLFIEISYRRDKLLATCPDAKIINLGIGDTTEPIPDLIVDSFVEKAKKLGTDKGYTGYGESFGHPSLREGIAKKMYKGLIEADDVFISDGAKCDLGRLQVLFGRKCTVGIQDPSYPVYVGTSVMTGKTGEYNPENSQYKGIVYLPCSPKNGFFPDLEKLPHLDIIWVCSPNNPTGTVLLYEQLEQLVNIARKKKSFIVFDSAYAGFIRGPSLPRSIYEIKGAENVAIEISSFSKLSGFTGVRLGWSVVPKQLRFVDGSSVQEDWKKIITTFFNGASNIAQEGGIAAISEDGLSQSQKLCDYYLENADILRNKLESKGYTCFGGDNAPYLWLDLKGRKSWEIFDKILYNAHIITTPGSGFGPAGEGFLRLSSFGKKESIIEAADRLHQEL